ncbi:uncharacterized protein LOC124817010 [Hydra vulgaris]|uniref:uncharacterized protein LOC124817010 n=1 Tax=Hydra vulgaris TaxID=6087 RepID=UPI001F5E841F|nr:uncharacterized protein LOC124817010 [Hydra vulgaris]
MHLFIPHTSKIGKTILTESNDIAIELNKHFTTIGTKLSNSIPNINDKHVNDAQNLSNSNINYTEVTYTEFDDAFKSLKKNKATGYDGINGNIIIDSYDIIKNILYKIFRASIIQGSLPDYLKIAKIIPVFKTGEHINMNNYRRISILSFFSKIIERIMHNRIYTYLIENKLLYENQFKWNNSTEHAVLQLTRNISESFKNGQFTLEVFIDLSKAFDTVDHKILLKKLVSYGIIDKTVNWFKSYLTNRKQYVYNENSGSLRSVY